MILITGMQKVQNALRSQASTNRERSESGYEPKMYSDFEEFERFCQRLQEEKEFRESYVSVRDRYIRKE